MNKDTEKRKVDESIISLQFFFCKVPKWKRNSLDTSLLMMIYHQIEFGCKRPTGLELIKGKVETIIF